MAGGRKPDTARGCVKRRDAQRRDWAPRAKKGEQTPRTVGVAPIGTRIRLPSRPGHSARTGVPSAAYTGTSPLAGLRSLLRSDGGNRPPFVQLACRRPWSVVYEPSAAAWPLSRHCSAGAAGRHDTSQIAVHWFALLNLTVAFQVSRV